MRPISLRLNAILAAVFAILAFTACSSDDPGLLPGDDAQQILTNLDRVEELAANGDCSAALESIETISGQIAALPDSVNDRLRQNLRRGVARLSEVTAASCGDSDDESETVTETVPVEPDTTPEDEETTAPEDETEGDQGGRSEGRGRGGDRGGRSGGSGGNEPDSGPGAGRGSPGRSDSRQPVPPRGGDGGGQTQQPSPGGGETTPDDNTDSGGISPNEPAGTEGTP